MACLAMIASERLGYSVGIEYYSGGFDPGSSSIGNSISRFEEQVRLMNQYGFTNVSVDAGNEDIERVLQSCGPFLLSHFMVGFPYGTGAQFTDPSISHAVVITGFDSSINGGTCWMNNPWGYKDQPILSSAVTNAINKWQSTVQMGAVTYYDQS